MASTRPAGLDEGFGDLRALSEIDLDLPDGGWMGAPVRSDGWPPGRTFGGRAEAVPVPTLKQ